ncbi:MAG TPA: ABC transporter substrate-binding protein [Anaerolineales bacterium]|jgi:putative ABC transport system substrate-binding protein
MRRRHYLLAFALSFASVIAVLGSPLSSDAEPAQKVVRVGFVGLSSPSTAVRAVAQFRERLRELGWIEGQNLVIEERWAEGRYDRLPALMADVLGRKVDVLVTYTTQAAIAAKNATNMTPIVVAAVADPVRSGLVATLARPGSNLTGLSTGWGDGMVGKWLELLQETVPRLSTVAVFERPDNPIARDLAKELQAIARARSVKLRLIEVREPGAIGRAFEQGAQKAQAVLVLPDPMFSEHRSQLTFLAGKYRLPTIYYVRDFVDAGGLMAYGPDLAVMFRRAAEYVDKILKGAKPADLPIEQPTKFELVVNLKTAKALGITIPQSILLRADEVIR